MDLLRQDSCTLRIWKLKPINKNLKVSHPRMKDGKKNIFYPLKLNPLSSVPFFFPPWLKVMAYGLPHSINKHITEHRLANINSGLIKQPNRGVSKLLTKHFRYKNGVCYEKPKNAWASGSPAVTIWAMRNKPIYLESHLAQRVEQWVNPRPPAPIQENQNQRWSHSQHLEHEQQLQNRIRTRILVWKGQLIRVSTWINKSMLQFIQIIYESKHTTIRYKIRKNIVKKNNGFQIF